MVSLLAVPLLGVTWSAAWSAPSSAATTTSAPSRSAQPLRAPKTTVEQDSKYFTEVTEADPSLETYEQKKGNVALEALLTDGSAFCALLKHGGGIDEALVAEAEGARSTETQTSLPLSVTTFNAIESVSLLTLCPCRTEARAGVGAVQASPAATPICPS